MEIVDNTLTRAGSIAPMAEPASTFAADSVGTVETRYLDLPKPVRLNCGQELHPVRVAYETYGASCASSITGATSSTSTSPAHVPGLPAQPTAAAQSSPTPTRDLRASQPTGPEFLGRPFTRSHRNSEKPRLTSLDQRQVTWTGSRRSEGSPGENPGPFWPEPSGRDGYLGQVALTINW